MIDWNKGKAVEFLLESLGLCGKEDVLPIYVGDDKTDEDAFKVSHKLVCLLLPAKYQLLLPCLDV